jgi:hypothetical protein
MSLNNEERGQFLLNLLLTDNKCVIILDFINTDTKQLSTNYACICVSMGMMDSYKVIQTNFKDEPDLINAYLNIYTTAIANYETIVENNIRQIFVDETYRFYPLNLKQYTITNIISNLQNKTRVINIMNNIKEKHSAAIISRNDEAFIIIHYENDDYIIIDPHLTCCGILTMDSIYKYITFDGIWDFEVNIMTLNENQGPVALVEPSKATATDSMNVE